MGASGVRGLDGQGESGKASVSSSEIEGDSTSDCPKISKSIGSSNHPEQESVQYKKMVKLITIDDRGHQTC